MDRDLQALDSVELLSTKRVTYLSDFPGSMPEPDGLWIIAGFMEGDVLATKGTAVIRVPLADVRVAQVFDANEVFLELEKRPYNQTVKRHGDYKRQSREGSSEE